MQIKSSNREKTNEDPQDKLKFISFIDDLQSTRALNPVTPERKNKEWVMDAWEDHRQWEHESPQKSKYINQMIQNYEGKGFRLKKVEFMSEKVPSTHKLSTPLRQKNQEQARSLEKQNKTEKQIEKKIRPRQFSISRPVKKSVPSGEEESGPFKIALGSVIYPVERQSEKRSGSRRIQRFHSFVARTIRR